MARPPHGLSALPPMFRYCMPRVRTQGHGLGNELVPWARAFLAARILDARLLPPAFGLNRRAYWQDFDTSPDDWIYHRAIERMLPVIEFTEADFIAHGGGSAVSALRSFAAAHRLRNRSVYVLVTEGLWGGYGHVAAAREFMRSTLYRSRYAAGNLLRLQQRIDPRKVLVGMHVRLGDFVAPTSIGDYRRVANASLPLDWFCKVADGLQERLGDDWQLLLVSDGGPERLRALLEGYPCVTTGDMAHRDCSDALALASADLLVCSASSYSSLAAFLSDAPYLCFAPSLFAHPEGCYSMHGDPPPSRPHCSPTPAAVRYFAQARDAGRVSDAGSARGVAVEADGRIPPATLERVLRRREARRWELDLVCGGVTPIGSESGG
ncbi:MAG TPA: hypothetical protein VIX87_12295 [Steroidobacteraceae bacterium]